MIVLTKKLRRLKIERDQVWVTDLDKHGGFSESERLGIRW
jgi:hypothetical protein